MWPLLYTLLILALSSIPGSPPDPREAGTSLGLLLPASLQNLLHIPLFTGLTLTWHFGLTGWHLGGWRRDGLAAGLSLGTGILDEWHQAFVPGRFPSATDVMLDSVGIGLALGVLVWIGHHQAHRPGGRRW